MRGRRIRRKRKRLGEGEKEDEKVSNVLVCGKRRKRLLVWC